MTDLPDGPFDGDGLPEIALARAPLVRVLCQVAWPEQTLLTSSFDQIADELALSLASEYPTRQASATQAFQIGLPGGQVHPVTPAPSRQWASLDEVWALYFTPTFVTLENRGQYTSRDEMTRRFDRVLQAVQRFAQVPTAQRIGWRYVNRVADPVDYADLDSLVKPTVLGARAVPATADVQLIHSLSDSLFMADRGTLAAKWRFIPAGTSHDSSILPTSTPSWILDLDAFRDRRTPFDAAALITEVREFSSFAHDFFRWAVTDSFIERFGG